MTALVYLVPIALLLGCTALAAFLWALKSGQFEDLEGAGWRVLEDDASMERSRTGGTTAWTLTAQPEGGAHDADPA